MRNCSDRKGQKLRHRADGKVMKGLTPKCSWQDLVWPFNLQDPEELFCFEPLSLWWLVTTMPIPYRHLYLSITHVAVTLTKVVIINVKGVTASFLDYSIKPDSSSWCHWEQNLQYSCVKLSKINLKHTLQKNKGFFEKQSQEVENDAIIKLWSQKYKNLLKTQIISTVNFLSW